MSPERAETLPAATLPKGTLPAGQIAGKAFIRFGLGRFRWKKIDCEGPARIELRGLVARPGPVDDALSGLTRITQVSDFHCVTTWSIFGVEWQGVRFAEFCERIARPLPEAGTVVFTGRDGYRCAMQLADLMAGDVLLADRLDGAPLGLDHGGPLRLIAPAHYGYKSVKHIAAIEFRKDRRGYRFPLPYPALMDHPRGRVALEERARFVPSWLIKPFYRLFVPRVVRRG